MFAVPPDEPIIYDSEGMRLLDVSSPVPEGESLTLTCETSGGESGVVGPGSASQRTMALSGGIDPNIGLSHMVTCKHGVNVLLAKNVDT